MLHPAARNYFREIRKSLPCSRTMKAKYIRALSNSVITFCNENPGSTVFELSIAFGSPKQITEAWLNDYGDSHFISQQKRKRFILRLVAIVVIATAIYVTAATAYTYKKHKEMREGRAVVTVTEGETEEDPSAIGVY